MRPGSLRAGSLCGWSLLLGLAACGGEPRAPLAEVDDTLVAAETAPPQTVTAGPLAIASVAAARPVVTTDQRRHLVYELVIQNLGTTGAPADVRIVGLDVSDPERGRRGAIASYRPPALAAVLLGVDPATGALPVGGLAAAFLDIALPADCPLPRRLAHAFLIERGGAVATLSGPQVPIVDERARALGPPLHGPNLLDLNGCCQGLHTLALLPMAGQLVLAQRYAIDFVRVTEEGSFSGDPTQNQSYFLYGAEVVAVTSGRIVEVVDGVAENIPTQPLPPFSVDTAAGNHIVEALDDGRFALYAHLQPGTLRVSVGARVRRGQVLALVGNTGNSTEPHLHFHVTDGPTALGSNGVPYVFDRFDFIAHLDLTTPDGSVTFVPPPQERRGLLPMAGDVIGFR